MSNLFTSIKTNRPRSNSFNLSHEKKLSMKMANLVPILVQEVVPGDKFRVSSEQLIRLAPMIKPVMHRISSYIHYFFVPNRLLWNEWQDFITGGEDGESNPTFPHMTTSNIHRPKFYKGTLPDYMGIPITHVESVQETLNLSALPFRAYQMIYNEYYRDQNLQDKIEFALTGGLCSSDDHTELTLMRRRAWEKDYFTSAQTTPQKGGDVTLPLDLTMEPDYLNQSEVLSTVGAPQTGTLTGNAGNLETGAAASRIQNLEDEQQIDGTVTINDLRRATRLQEWLERNMRGGSRYIESILSHFGVKSSDSRLQRPQYLGGGKTPITISEVLNTTGSEAVDFLPQGNQSGYGIGVGNAKGFKRSFEEHGYIIGIMSVLPRTAYQQGLHRHFSKFDKFDYFWPEFANLGEQEILNKELFHDYTTGTAKDDPFGYQSRYAEYKFNQDSVHGDFRENLAFWHLSRIFDDLPALNDNFIKCNPDTRIFAVSEPETPYDEKTDHLYVQLYNNIRAIRPMPIFGTPTL